MRVVIIGAGPAGLTAAYELAHAGVTDVVVLEATRDIGGLAKTVNYKGNRIDIGGHRFFSKSDWVMDWWLHMLPLAHEDMLDARGRELLLAYQGKRRSLRAVSNMPSSDERVPLEKIEVEVPGLSVELLDLDRALDELGRLDPRQALIVEMHCFAGLTVDEVAPLLETSARTVAREWKMARAFLASRV